MVNPARLVKLLIITLVTLISIGGLFPNRYVNDRVKFVPSKVNFIYCILFTIIFTMIYGTQIYWDYTNGQFNLRDAVKMYGYMNVIVAVINYIEQIAIGKKVARFMSTVPVFKTIEFFSFDNATLRRAVSLALIRALVFPIVIEITLILQQQRNHPERSLWWTIYTLFPMVIANLLNNCYFGSMIVAKSIMRALNFRLQDMALEINFLQLPEQMELQKPYYRMQRFCELADMLDELALKYTETCLHSKMLLELMGLPLVCSLLCNVLGITVGMFNQYQAVVETYSNEDESYDIFAALTNGVFLIVSFVELTLLSYLCDDMFIKSKETGEILQSMTLRHADIRFKQAMESFSLLISTIKYKINPLGLFEINVSTVNEVLSAVASFLLILVQSDLTLRFLGK